jgi:hypothetical protein
MRPIDTSTSSFEKLIQRKNLYVDKTALLYQLVTGSSEYFCSRPRRFGKSLTLSTLEAIFQGRRELFKGLAIDSTDYDWKVYPVIHIDFGGCDSSNPQMLEEWLAGVIQDYASEYRIELPAMGTAAGRFSRLIDILGKDAPVVVLVDEYEKVISDHIYDPEVEGMRDVLGDFYQVIKAKESVIRFAFVTGVTKYAKMSIFSRLNNLTDITMHPRYATLFGYTQEELETNFTDYIYKGVVATGMGKDTYLAMLKRQYDGYCFCPGKESVYNPVSIGRFFDAGGESFDNYWIDTGGNLQLVMDVAEKVGFILSRDLGEPLGKSYLGTFDILSLKSPAVTRDELKSLLEQTGYLTIAPRTPVGSQLIWLDFPNDEVRGAFTVKLLARQGLGSESELSLLRQEIMQSAIAGDVPSLAGSIKSLFSQIPYELHLKDERYYHSVFLSFMMALGAHVEGEKSVSEGRIDAVLEMPKHLYVIEFKRDKNARIALNQVLGNHYGDGWKYLGKKKSIHLIGLDVNTSTRSVDVRQEQIVS